MQAQSVEPEINEHTGCGCADAAVTGAGLADEDTVFRAVIRRVDITEIHAADALSVRVINDDILDDLSRLDLCPQPAAVHLRRERLAENEELLHGGIVAPADDEIGVGVGYGAERDLIAGDDRQVAGLE